MDKSQRRLSGKTALTSGQRLKLVVALILAASVAGVVMFEPNNHQPVAYTGKVTGIDCTDKNYADMAEALACSSGTAVRAATEASNSSAQAAAGTATNNQLRPLQDKRSSDVRRRPDNQSSAQIPRPGYTLVMRCSESIQNNNPQCRSENYSAQFNASESASTAGYTISGRVVTPGEGGLGGVNIVASPQRLKDKPEVSGTGTLRFSTVTDSLGAYTLDGLPEGEYTIRSGTHGPYQSARIAARTGVTYADLVVFKNSAAVVAGQVLTANREPLEGVTVLPLLSGQPSVLTGDDGRFQLPVTLKPTINSFTLRFQRPGFSEQTSRVERQKPNLAVATGESGVAPAITPLMVVMHPVESWTALDGTVSSETGEPLAGRMVELRLRTAQQKYTTTTDAQGGYSFPVVESPADYRLIIFGGADHKDYQQNLSMTAATAELNVFLEPYEFGEVSGRLVNQNGVAVADFGLVLRNTGSQKPNATVRTDENGKFAIEAMPAGDLVVASQSTPAILVQGLHLDQGDNLQLPLVLDWGDHEIRGSVVDANGNPVPASRVVLQWSYELEGVSTKATRRTAADTQGHFAFSNLGPGPHSLQINAPGFSTVDINHDLRRQGYDLTVRLN
jgi:hypothetical protein